MRIVDIPAGQGSQAWHEHRRSHFNASDAPAMMGCSPYESRTELLRRLATGVEGEVDPETQRRFDKGHQYEAWARPIAEKIIGEDLYPIVMANGKLSASLDGATLDGSILFEHKTLGAELADMMPETGSNLVFQAKALPLHYRVQMEQQLHCSGAQRVLFMASKWADDGTLLDERNCWYEPDMKLRQQILAGWEQFEKDLAEYKPAEPAPAVVAAVVESLPSPSVRLDGALVVQSNLPAFGVALKEFVERIPKRPSTDQEFADAEAACKALKRAEEALESAESAALASMADVEAMRRMVSDFRSLARTTRLASEKLVKERKEQIRFEEVQRGQDAMSEHLSRINARLGGAYLTTTSAAFGTVIKGLKSLDSLRNAIDTEIARAKIEANEAADRIESNLKTIAAAAEHQSLFADRRELVLKDPEAVAAIVAGRVAEFKAEQERRMEAERARIRAEEAARAAAEVQRAQAPVTVTPGLGTGGTSVAQPPVSIGTPAPTIPPSGPPMKLGAVCDKLGFVVSEAFVRDTLKVPVHRDGRAVLIAAADWPRLKTALIRHIEGV